MLQPLCQHFFYQILFQSLLNFNSQDWYVQEGQMFSYQRNVFHSHKSQKLRHFCYIACRKKFLLYIFSKTFLYGCKIIKKISLSNTLNPQNSNEFISFYYHTLWYISFLKFLFVIITLLNLLYLQILLFL